MQIAPLLLDMQGQGLMPVVGLSDLFYFILLHMFPLNCHLKSVSNLFDKQRNKNFAPFLTLRHKRYFTPFLIPNSNNLKVNQPRRKKRNSENNIINAH